MRTNFFLVTLAVATAFGFSASAQNTTGAGTGATGSATGTTAPTSGPSRVGFAVQDGVTYLLQRGTVNPVTESMLPPGQILMMNGQLFPDSGSERGFVMEKGVVYWADGRIRTRVDTGLIPGGQMMTLDGVVRSLPPGVTHFPGVQVITTPTGATPATSEPN